MSALGIILVIIVGVLLFWWNNKGKRNLQRRAQYNAEQRRIKMEAEDKAWREKQRQKNN
jgi:hypothetical protein